MTTTDSKGSLKESKEDRNAESDTKYSVLYESGLEAVDQDHAPEVVSGSNVNRKSSLLKPEAYNAAPYYSDKEEHQSYEAPQALRPESEGMQTLSMDSKEAMMGEQEVNGRQEQRQQRRCCGIRRKIFIAIVVAVAVIVCIGIILGAVLGTLLPMKSAKNATLETWSGTGLASTGLASVLAGDGSGRLLTYYQDPDGRIIENSYVDGQWTLEDRTKIDSSVVTTKAAYGSQLAAISYPLNGKTYRQIFFVSSTGAIMTTNSTETTDGISTDWSVEMPITHDRVDPKGIGLAACWGFDTMNSIRAFYPSQYGYIQEVKWVFGEDYWKQGGQIDSSDSESGMGCAVKNGGPKQYLNLYYRNTASGKVKQAYIIFTGKIFWSYTDGPTSWSNKTIAIGSDIAVCDDSSQTEYVYYQLNGGLVTRGVINPTVKNYEEFDDLQGATVGSKLACSFIDGGSMLFFQNRSSTDTIYASDISRTGVPISNFAVP